MSQVNRYFKDKHIDAIDHALGRPVNPLGETYREYYCANSESPIADHMRDSHHWIEGKSHNNSTTFYVSDEGRKHLADHLKQIGDPHRLYHITYKGYDGHDEIVSTSHSKAKYSAYLNVVDCYEDMAFLDFCKMASVRLAPQPTDYVR